MNRKIPPAISPTFAAYANFVNAPSDGKILRLGVETKEVIELYRTNDFLLLPSRFDTFGCVVLEAMRCGLPVAAYNTKGPKDIIQHRISGILAETKAALAGEILKVLENPDGLMAMKEAARNRSRDYTPQTVLNRFLADVELSC